MPNKFKVGDIVVGNAEAAEYTVTHPGSVCEVVADFNGGLIRVKVIRTKSFGDEGQAYTVWAYKFDHLVPPFDPDKPVKVRATGEAVSLIKRDDKDRPFAARVNVPSLGPTDLTFTPCGRFHASADSPMDLVNG